MKKIILEVMNGCVEVKSKIPKGVALIIRDFDVEGRDVEGMKYDSDGYPYTEDTYEGE